MTTPITTTIQTNGVCTLPEHQDPDGEHLVNDGWCGICFELVPVQLHRSDALDRQGFDYSATSAWTLVTRAQ